MKDLEVTGRKITDKDREQCAPKLHYCPEYDYMAIDEECVEFENCLCYKG